MTSKSMLEWQYQQVISELQQVQLHASDPSCPCGLADIGEYCLAKHTLMVTSLAGETSAMDDANSRLWDDLQESATKMHKKTKDAMCNKSPYPDLITWSREWRKKIEPLYYACSVKTGKMKQESAFDKLEDWFDHHDGPYLIGHISGAIVHKINLLGFNALESDVILTKSVFDYIINKHEKQLTRDDWGYLEKALQLPSEILPNIGTDEAPHRAKSVLFVYQGNYHHVVIVEVTELKKVNVVWNFWKMSASNAEKYLKKFRHKQSELHQSGETTSSSHVPHNMACATVGKPEGRFSGSQTDQSSLRNGSLAPDCHSVKCHMHQEPKVKISGTCSSAVCDVKVKAKATARDVPAEALKRIRQSPSMIGFDKPLKPDLFELAIRKALQESETGRMFNDVTAEISPHICRSGACMAGVRRWRHA